MTYGDVTSNERTIAGALALVMHLLFFSLLVFGVNWQKRQADTAAIVDLWNSLPPLPQPKAETPPAEVKPPPEPPKPAPRVEPAPKPEAKPEAKPDIALKEKLEKERKRKEQEKIEQERKRKEQEKLETKKREEEKARLAALREKQEKDRLAKEQDEALKKLAQQQAAQAAAQAREIDEFTRRIRDKIRRFIVEPPGLQGNPEVEFDVVLLPGGEVLSVRLRKSSAIAAYDSAVERAILKAQPLPLPPDPAMFRNFRELNLKIRPKE